MVCKLLKIRIRETDNKTLPRSVLFYRHMPIKSKFVEEVLCLKFYLSRKKINKLKPIFGYLGFHDRSQSNPWWLCNGSTGLSTQSDLYWTCGKTTILIIFNLSFSLERFLFYFKMNHSTRLYLSEEDTNERKTSDVGNVEAGTVVDYAITGKDSKEFYLASQMPKQVNQWTLRIVCKWNLVFIILAVVVSNF